MKRLFTKSDLQNGDIIELRNGTAGFVYKDSHCILYSPAEADELYSFTEDMCHRGQDPDRDIVSVYRPQYSQNDYQNYKRFPSVFDRGSGNIYIEKEDPAPAPAAKPKKKNAVEEKPRIRVILVCSALRKWHELSVIPSLEDTATKIGLLEFPSMDYMNLNNLPLEKLPIPGSEGLVIIYFPFQDARWLEREKEDSLHRTDGELRPVMMIPETGQQVLSRCMICRQTEDGQLQSIQDEDYPQIMRCMTL